MLDNISSVVNSLNAQQTMFDVTANNIANINSAAYKKNRFSFREALYHSAFAPGMPVSEDVKNGGGVTVSGTEKDFGTGALVNTERQLDFAVDGKGFFGMVLPDGTLGYSRQGDFHLDGNLYFVNGQGVPVYADMALPVDYQSLAVDENGEISARLADGQWEVVGYIPLFYVPNPAGLEAIGEGLYRETEASGTVSQGTAGMDGLGKIKQGHLEQSNVDLAQEMVNVIIAQRSFQFSCQALRTLDDMWGIANNLQR